MKSRRAAPDGFVPYASFHAVTRRLRARLVEKDVAIAELQAKLEAARAAATEKVAPRPVLCGGVARPVVVLAPSNRHAETERNGLTQSSAGETGGIGQETPVR
jgi:hypothetical protein